MLKLQPSGWFAPIHYSWILFKKMSELPSQFRCELPSNILQPIEIHAASRLPRATPFAVKSSGQSEQSGSTNLSAQVACFQTESRCEPMSSLCHPMLSSRESAGCLQGTQMHEIHPLATSPQPLLDQRKSLELTQTWKCLPP